jgi:hypothetical protein
MAIRTISEVNGPQGRSWWGKARRRKEQRNLARMATLPRIAWASAREWPGFVVTLVRVAPSTGLDDDNLRPALKSIRDGVADALGLKSDRDPRVRWEYGQRRGDYAVEVTIERTANVESDVLQSGKVTG